MTASLGLHVGVVGAGYWGSKHVRALRSLPDVSQVCVIEPDADRVSALEGSMPGVHGHATLGEALSCVDAVVIATPPTTHAPIALQAIHAGKHVMVEKPLATSVSDGTRIVEAAAQQNVVAMVGHTFEYHSAVWRLRDMIASGELGELYYLDTERLNMGLYQHDVNVLWDLAPHDVSILNYVLGSRPGSVECWGAKHAHNRLEDVAHLRLRYENPRVEANVHVSWLHPSKTRVVTAVGSRRMVVFDDLATEERIRVHHKGVTQHLELNDDLTQPPMSYQYGDVVSPYLVVNEPLSVEDQHFVDCIRTGLEPLTGGASGLAVVETLQAAEVSMREGRRVDIAEMRSTAFTGASMVSIPQQARSVVVGRL